MDESEDDVYENVSEENWIEKKGWASELVDKILERLRKSNPSISKDSEIVVVRSTIFNAYAVTGNYIYVSRSLLEKCPNEETAAFVIAHELAHQDLGHLEAFPQWARPIMEKPSWSKLPLRLILLVFGAIRRCFTPRIECDADLAGLNFCINAGYDPTKCIAFFDILQFNAVSRGAFLSTFGPDDESDDELNENASFMTKFNIWRYYMATRSLPIRDRREYLLQKLEARGIVREKRRRVAQKL